MTEVAGIEVADGLDRGDDLRLIIKDSSMSDGDVHLYIDRNDACCLIEVLMERFSIRINTKFHSVE